MSSNAHADVRNAQPFRFTHSNVQTTRVQRSGATVILSTERKSSNKRTSTPPPMTPKRGSGVSVSKQPIPVSKQPIPLYHLVRTRDASIIFFEANKSDLLCIPGSCQAAGWMKFSCDPGGGSTKWTPWRPIETPRVKMQSMRHSDTTRGKELKMKVMREMLSRLINLFIQTLMDQEELEV